MTEIALNNGTCLGFGGTNARVGQLAGSELYHSTAVATPTNFDDFASWMARRTLEAADRGDTWVVAGFPGLVSPDGNLVGPMANIECFKQRQVDLRSALTAADPAAGRLFESGFQLIAVNDGELAAQAVAGVMALPRHRKIGALIIGTGVGAGIVERDAHESKVYRPDRSCPVEIGHLIIGSNPSETYENEISGPALTRSYGDMRSVTAEHPASRHVGKRAAQLVMVLGLMQGVDLVVPTGGVGAGASDKYGPHMHALLDDVRMGGNGAQKQLLPEVATIDPAESQVFELYGAPGVMRDFMTRSGQTAVSLA